MEALLVAGTAGESMRSLPSVRTVDGRGLEGDRYLRRSGHWSGHRWEPITLVSVEALEYVSHILGRPVGPAAARRNVVTQGVSLETLVGRGFRVGDVVLRGTRLCDPCRYLEELTGIGGLKEALKGRGGLRAVIVEDGTIRLNDAVVPLEVSTTTDVVDSRPADR